MVALVELLDYENSLTGCALNQPALLENQYYDADRRGAHAVEHRQLAIGRQPFTRRVITVGDALGQVLGYLVG
jgi:hypothetical protein